MNDAFDFSNRHKDLMARDEEYVLGWRFEPRIIFERGAGVQLFDIDGNTYYDLSSGMMSLTLGHAHPELVETIRDMADRFVHQSSWYTNPWAIEFAELLATTLPGDLKMTNFAVTGSEANEIAMRMALGATDGFDICSMVRGLHGGSLAAEAITSVGGARRRGLGPLSIPARSDCIVPAFYYRAPVDDSDQWDEISLRMTEELIEYTTSQEVAALMLEPIAVPGGMIVPSERWLKGIRDIADRWGALLIFDECQLAPARLGTFWGFEPYNVVPDIVTFGKGLSAGFAFCGTVTTPEIAERTRGTKGLPWAGTYPQLRPLGHCLNKSQCPRERSSPLLWRMQPARCSLHEGAKVRPARKRAACCATLWPTRTDRLPSFAAVRQQPLGNLSITAQPEACV